MLGWVVINQEKGAGIGALGGAAGGGLIGAAVGHPGAGAAIGGALGLGAGALVGDHFKDKNNPIPTTTADSKIRQRSNANGSR